ncbi:MAG: efflux RND transporter periplasmic adaptor subunit, partial [Bacteroidota bacterium]
MKIIFKYILFTTLTAALITGCNTKKETAPNVAAKFEMSDTMLKESTFADARLENAQNEIRLFGKVTAENNNMAQVFPAVGGSVISIKAELGDYVKQGQLLASIRSSEVAGYQSQTSDADANLSIAERNL